MSEHISLCMLHCMGPGEERSVGNSDKLHADRMSAFSINNNASRVQMYTRRKYTPTPTPR